MLDFLLNANLSIPMVQLILLMLMSTISLLFGKLKLALLINYVFTLHWAYVANRDNLIGMGLKIFNLFPLSILYLDLELFWWQPLRSCFRRMINFGMRDFIKFCCIHYNFALKGQLQHSACLSSFLPRNSRFAFYIPSWITTAILYYILYTFSY